jgi:hypothetical protein
MAAGVEKDHGVAADVQLPGPGRAQVGAPFVRCDSRVAYRAQPVCRVPGRGPGQARGQRVLGKGRQGLAGGVERGVLDPAGRVSGRVAGDEAAFDVRGVRADAGRAQPGGVEHRVVAAALQKHRVIGGGLVEVGGRGQAAFGQLQLMPVGGGGDPTPRRGARGPLADQRDDLADVAGAGDWHGEDIAGRQHQVVVRVDERGQRDQPRVVEHHGARAVPGGQQVALVSGPGDGHDRASADCQGGHRARRRTHGVHRGRPHEQLGCRPGTHPRFPSPGPGWQEGGCASSSSWAAWSAW